MEEVYIGLGSNIGDKGGFLRQAVQQIMALPRIEQLECSSIWQTAPWGTTGQDVYFNAAARFFSGQEPEELLHSLQKIEHDLGRRRPYHWAPRTIDLDMLLFGGRTIQSPELSVPHPLMKQRLFVLMPLQELNPGLVFPDGETLEQVVKAQIDKDSLDGIFRTEESWK